MNNGAASAAAIAINARHAPSHCNRAWALEAIVAQSGAIEAARGRPGAGDLARRPRRQHRRGQSGDLLRRGRGGGAVIVNLSRIKGMRRRLPRGHYLVVEGGAVISVGPSYAAGVIARLKARRWRAE